MKSHIFVKFEAPASLFLSSTNAYIIELMLWSRPRACNLYESKTYFRLSQKCAREPGKSAEGSDFQSSRRQCASANALMESPHCEISRNVVISRKPENLFDRRCSKITKYPDIFVENGLGYSCFSRFLVTPHELTTE